MHNQSMQQSTNKMSMVAQTHNPTAQNVEAVGWRVQGQPGLHSETLSQKTKVWESS
jgi:hypothetical protein